MGTSGDVSGEFQPGSPSSLRPLAEVAVEVLALVVAYSFLPLRGDHWWSGFGVGALLIALSVPLAVRRLRAVQVSTQPYLAAFSAILLLLTTLIVGFSATYYALGDHPGQLSGVVTRIDAVYFTVTTLSTVGFGDITATGQTARVVVTVQILVNLVFIGVVVRALSAAARDRRRTV